MAKKKTEPVRFKLAEAARELVGKNTDVPFKDFLEILKKANPSQPINEGSAQQAWSAARRKLGVAGTGTKTKRVPKPTAQEAPRTSESGSTLSSAIVAARKLLSAAGSPTEAKNVIDLLSSDLTR